MSEPVRLSKRLVELVSCSRREAELYIEGGWVMVDGVVVEEPQFKVLDQVVSLHPDANQTPLEPVTILLHWPLGIAADNVDAMQALITRESHAADDNSGIRTLNSHFRKLFAAAPIQYGACGLVVFSQDWRVLRKLNEDAHKNEQEYIVEVSGEPVFDGLALLNRPPVKASWQNETRLRFAVKNPQPGQIANACHGVGLAVKSMKRIRIGGVSMGKLPVGQWRYLAPYEKF
ncbi:MAG TPA: rRNA pseudouridine synthase [Pseudomonadales bacterium]|nr:rRNA pseudouridine synthase [Pseudomonadales bacterium]